MVVNPGARGRGSQGRIRFCFVDVEFEKPVSHPREDVKQAVSDVDLELRGRGPAAINLGAVNVLMVFKARMNEITQGVGTWRAGGTSWHLPLALPGMATPGTILHRALSWVPVHLFFWVQESLAAPYQT